MVLARVAELARDERGAQERGSVVPEVVDDRVGELGGDEQEGDVGVGQLKVEFGRGQTPVEGDEDRAEAEAREQGDDRGGVVGSELFDVGWEEGATVKKSLVRDTEGKVCYGGLRTDVFDVRAVRTRSENTTQDTSSCSVRTRK